MVGQWGDAAFAKEMTIRRRIAAIFNKREEDFASLRDFNDYLEEVEDMTVKLVEGIDVPAIEAKIVQYQRENAEQIMVAHALKAEEYAAALAASKSQPMHEENGVSASNNSQAGTSAVTQGQYAPSVTGGTQPRPLGTVQQSAPVLYGSGDEVEDAENKKERSEKAARAGGWSMELSKKRALEEAFGSIWI